MGNRRVPQLRKANVLAVDDYPANIVALEAVIGSDFNLISATSGAEAIEMVKTRSDIDVILMDIQMPEMDGYETASEIKKIKAAEEIPIIFITAVYREDPFIKKGYQAGGVDYFSKPFDPEILKLKLSIYASVRQKTEILKEREKHLKETEELLSTGRKLATMLEGLPVGVLISDTEGRICQINNQVSRICDASAVTRTDSYREMLGWWDSTGKVIVDENAPLHRALGFGETSHNKRIQISCANREPKDVLCSASPLLGLDGHIVGAVVVLQDVSESSKIEKDLEARITRLVSVGVEIEESIQH